MNDQVKKGGKAKKIVICIIALILVCAIVVCILNLTGVLNLNLSKKSKMVAGVEKLGESITEPLTNVLEDAEKNGTEVKIFKNLSLDEGIETSSNISFNIEEVEIDSLSSSEQKTVDTIVEVLNDTELSGSFKYDGDKSAYAGAEISVSDVKVTGDAVYDGKQAGIKSEEINSKWLTVTNSELEKMLDEMGISEDFEELEDSLNEVIEQYENLANSLELDEKTMDKISERYSNVLKDYINEKSKDIEKEKATIKVDGKSKNTSKYTLKLKEKDIKELIGNYIDTIKKDEDLKKILEGSLETLNDTYAADIDIDEFYEELDYIKEELDDTTIDVTIELIVYGTSTKTYRTDIIVKASSVEALALETTFNKNSTEIMIKSMSAKVAKIEISEKDNGFGVKVESQEALEDEVGKFNVELEFITGNDSSKITANFEIVDVANGNITFENKVNKNDDKEYDTTSTLSMDVNADGEATIKGSITMSSSIKIGSPSIPTISSSDSVSMTDDEEVEKYLTDSQDNITTLIKDLTKIKSIQKLLEEYDIDTSDLDEAIENMFDTNNTTPELPEIDNDDENTIDTDTNIVTDDYMNLTYDELNNMIETYDWNSIQY